MKYSDIIYTTKTANEQELHLHLKECDNDFIPPLSKRVNLDEYSLKLYERSVTFEAWSDQRIIGLIAAYFNNFQEAAGFITSVSVVSEFKGLGVASHLMSDCIKYAQNAQFTSILLEVNKASIPAINLYKKFGFADSESNEKVMMMKLIIPNSM
jgi:ribosomal protein S18 acetylase RimI-like enzyme